jgi:hypothetical protein
VVEPNDTLARGGIDPVAWKRGVATLSKTCLPQTPPVVCNMMRYRLSDQDPGPQIQYPTVCVDVPLVAAGKCILYDIDPASSAPGNRAYCCDASAAP